LKAVFIVDMKHKKDIIQLGMLVVLFIGICFGKTMWYTIFPTADSFGVKFNKERTRLGILPLPGNWTTEQGEKETKVWFPPVADTSAVHREMKVVGVENDRIKYENDFILKPKPDKEELTIGYRFTDTTWNYSFSSRLTHEKPYPITRQQADSILNAWNFKHK
jgi:hypothetical protein